LSGEEASSMELFSMDENRLKCRKRGEEEGGYVGIFILGRISGEGFRGEEG